MKPPLPRQLSRSQKLLLRSLWIGALACLIGLVTIVRGPGGITLQPWMIVAVVGVWIGVWLVTITMHVRPTGAPLDLEALRDPGTGVETFVCRPGMWLVLCFSAFMIHVIAGQFLLTQPPSTTAAWIALGGMFGLSLLFLIWPILSGWVSRFHVDAQGVLWVQRWWRSESVDPRMFAMIRAYESGGRGNMISKVVFSQGRGRRRRLMFPLEGVKSLKLKQYSTPGVASEVLRTVCERHGLEVRTLPRGVWVASPTAGAATQEVRAIARRTVLKEKLVYVGIGGFLLAGGGLMSSITIHEARIGTDLQRNGVVAGGQVVATEIRSKQADYLTFRYVPVEGGATYQATCAVNVPIDQLRVGQVVTIRYIPARPERALAEPCSGFGAGWNSATFTEIGMEMILPLLGLMAVIAGIRHKQPSRSSAQW